MFAFLLRGPSSEGSGDVAGLALPAGEFFNQRAIFLLAPFTALPEETQDVMLSNIIARLVAG